MGKARMSNDLAYLASPVTGGGVSVPRFHQLFLLAKLQGHKQPQDWAQYVWGILSMQGQRLIKEGKAMELDEENVQELVKQANEFETKYLPILKALEIV
jgi:hypothetical protein